jgi:hypothetical protein
MSYETIESAAAVPRAITGMNRLYLFAAADARQIRSVQQLEFLVDAIRQLCSQSTQETVKPPPAWMIRWSLAADGRRCE